MRSKGWAEIDAKYPKKAKKAEKKSLTNQKK
jgi:hypothetical protein